MKSTQSSKTKRCDGRRRSPPSDSPPSAKGEFEAALAYIKHFPRPELGEHPRHDGYNAGRALARAYSEKMQRVMQGFRQGVKDGTKAAETAGGQRQ